MTATDRTRPIAKDVPAIAALVAAIERIEQALDDENAALRTLAMDRLKDSGDRKARGLMELSRTIRASEGIPRSADLRARLERLRSRLDENRAALGLHLGAARDVAALIERAADEAESDGTYSRASVRPQP